MVAVSHAGLLREARGARTRARAGKLLATVAAADVDDELEPELLLLLLLTLRPTLIYAAR